MKRIPINLILFTGVAGGVLKSSSQWDIIVAKELVQYDIDASPLYKKYVIPSLDKTYLKADVFWSEKIFSLLKEKFLPLNTNLFNRAFLD